jgi:ankyrin repeat protein
MIGLSGGVVLVALFGLLARGPALERAVSAGDVRAVAILLRLGASPDYVGVAWRPVLHVALWNSQTDIVRLLLEHRANPNLRDPSGSTALHVAAMMNNAEAARMLLDYGADPDARRAETLEGRGMTPLHFAIQAGDEDFVKVMLEHGADVTAEISNNKPCLVVAAEHGQVEILKLLLQAPDAADHDTVSRALIAAVRHGYVPAVELLLKHGADPGYAIEHGETALIVAQRAGRPDLTKLLTARQAKR